MFARVSARFQYTLALTAMRVLTAAYSTLLIFSFVALMSEEARADEVADFVGAAPSGLPGINRVGVAAPRPGFDATFAANGGYGFTESQKGENGSHHRGYGTLGIALQPLRFLAAAFQLEGRVDKHPNDVLGSNTSALGEPRLLVRAAEAVGKSVALGAQLDWRLPGAQVPSLQPVASSLDARLLATFVPADQLAVAVNLGYRIDKTSELIDNVARIRRGDRISLGASQFDAIPIGVGISKRVGKAEITGEVTWDLLVGSNAPSAIESPLHFNVGGRYFVTEGFAAEARFDILASERPGTMGFDPVAPIDPRFTFSIGFRYTTARKPKPVVTNPTDNPNGNPTSNPNGAPNTGTLRGKITGDNGEPIANATVSVGDKTTQTGPDGSYTLTEVPLGKQSVSVKADGFEERTIEADVAAGTSTPAADIAVKHAIKPGSLRGLIRNFNGKPLPATIRVEPLGSETKTDADGVFSIDVPPGTYEVVVTASGYATQRRKMQVDENGVTILNADLRQGP